VRILVLRIGDMKGGNFWREIRFLVFGVLLMGTVVFGIGFFGGDSVNRFETVGVDVVREMVVDDGVVVIDLRTADEIASGYILGADLFIDFYGVNFEDRLDELDRGDKYLIYCRSGNRSGEALAVMKNMGFEEVYDLAGGIGAWTSSGGELVYGVRGIAERDSLDEDGFGDWYGLPFELPSDAVLSDIESGDGVIYYDVYHDLEEVVDFFEDVGVDFVEDDGIFEYEYVIEDDDGVYGILDEYGLGDANVLTVRFGVSPLCDEKSFVSVGL